MYTSEGANENAILDETTGKSLEYRNLIKLEKYKTVWENSFTKELDQLAQGKCGHQGTDIIRFIPRHKVPPKRKVMYGHILSIVAHKKKTPIEQGSQWAAIGLNT